MPSKRQVILGEDFSEAGLPVGVDEESAIVQGPVKPFACTQTVCKTLLPTPAATRSLRDFRAGLAMAGGLGADP